MQGPLDRHSFDVACPGCKIKNPKTLGWLKAHNQFICEGCGKNIDIEKTSI
jgi:transposase-like protein